MSGTYAPVVPIPQTFLLAASDDALPGLFVFDLAISPCPNDTYIFGHFVNDMKSGHALDLLQSGSAGTDLNVLPFEFHFADVEELNRRAIFEARHVLTKVSYHAAWKLQDSYDLLDCGGALGRGCGPILVSSQPGIFPDPGEAILVPGKWTTAHLLLRLFLHDSSIQSDHVNVIQTTYEQVLPSLAAGRARFGLIIHEERFTFQKKGMFVVQDLGAWWEAHAGLPIPLGAIALRRDHASMRSDLERAIRRSILQARKDFDSIRDFVRAHSQSLEDSVIQSHIDLYVNDFSMDIGDQGRRAVKELFARAQTAGI